MANDPFVKASLYLNDASPLVKKLIISTRNLSSIESFQHCITKDTFT